MAIIAGGEVKCFHKKYHPLFYAEKTNDLFTNELFTRVFILRCSNLRACSYHLFTFKHFCQFNVWAEIWRIYSAVEQVCRFLLSSPKVRTSNGHHLIGKVQMIYISLGTFLRIIQSQKLWKWLNKFESIKSIESQTILKQHKQLCSRHSRGECSHYHCNKTVNNRSQRVLIVPQCVSTWSGFDDAV